MRLLPSPLVCAALLAALAAAPAALAQGASKAPPDEPLIATPSEYSDDARKGYAQGLREARELLAKKRPDDAIARLDALLKERPREAQARFLRAVAIADTGRRDEAIAALRGLVADYPELPEAHNNLAVLYAAKGEYELARDELALAVAVRPDYAVARENLGDVYVRLAMAEYERAGKIDPANKVAAAKLRQARDIVGATLR